MIANPRQIKEHQSLDAAKLHPLLLGQAFQIRIVFRINRRPAQIVVPVWAGLHIDHLAGDFRNWHRRRLIGTFRGVEQVLIVVRPRLVIVVHTGHVRVVKNVGHNLRLARRFDFELAVAVGFPTALVLFLILPLGRIPRARFGFDVVPPHVPCAFAVGPHVLASDATRVTADALVQVENHGNL